MTPIDWILVAIGVVLDLGQIAVIGFLYWEESREVHSEGPTLILKVVAVIVLTLLAWVFWIIELILQLLAHGAGTPQFGWEMLGFGVPLVAFLFVLLTH